jgi:predicted metal-dependent hydrolase
MPGIGLRWTVTQRPARGPGVRGRLTGDELVLTGDVDDREACFEALRRAVARSARERLPLMLGGVEAETGWSASKVTVRRQRTRWGSCTAAHAVSLNESLVFLPQRLVRYVLVHELAHTRRLDHSPAFWALVEEYEASWRQARRDLRDAWRHVPVWADPS